jgi:hypothetical protein
MVIPNTVPSMMQGGYISLLLGIDQNAPATQKLHFNRTI